MVNREQNIKGIKMHFSKRIFLCMGELSLNKKSHPRWFVLRRKHCHIYHQ